MLILVSKDSIDLGVVREWQRLVQKKAKERGDDLSLVQPFPPFQQTYPEVLQAIHDNSPEGLEHYRRMVVLLPEYNFREEG